MFYTIRKRPDGEVLGIFSTREVLGFIPNNYPTTRDVDLITGIITKDLGMDIDSLWVDEITQPEYETYRDLHQFHVIV